MANPESFVVQGEAAESDDDEVSENDPDSEGRILKLLCFNFQVNTNYKVTIVDGEAPESDEGMSWN